MTTPERWLAASVADARARGVEGAIPVLETFARLMQVLREADWNDNPIEASTVKTGPAALSPQDIDS
jgi:hypothetical protein